MAAKRSFDRVIFILVVLLSACGLLMVYSASALVSQRDFGHPYHFLQRQGLAMILGFLCMVGLMRMDYRRLQNSWISWVPLAGSVLLLIIALLSPPVNGTHRWIRIAGLSIQPSELAKVALLIFLADLLARRRGDRGELRGPVLGCLVATGILVALVAMQPDLGTSLCLALLGVTALFASGVRMRYVLVPVLVVGIAGAAMVATNDYQWQRLKEWRLVQIVFGTQPDPEGAGYQVNQSVLAVGAGGVSGRGLGEGGQKLFFLPYPHTDFIYSNIGEELGFFGSMGVVVAFLLLMVRGLQVAARAPSLHLSLLAFGVTVMLVTQAFINMGVCLDLLPPKGLPLPFISYGGTSMLASLAASGLLLNASQHAT